ncbi:MAG: cytochrome c [Gemmatimonadales bacterium]|nr:cytochrome c [Gemmatimonadales bacterium]
MVRVARLSGALLLVSLAAVPSLAAQATRPAAGAQRVGPYKAGAGADVPTAQAAISPELIAKGKTVFTSSGLCFACHGMNAEGGVGPKLVGHTFLHSGGSYDEIVTFVMNGVEPAKAKYGAKSGMPARGGSKISDDDVKAVAAYVFSISR